MGSAPSLDAPCAWVVWSSFVSTYQLWLRGLAQATTTTIMGGAQPTDGAEKRRKNSPTREHDKKMSVVAEAGPSAVAALVMLSLVFGGCCSNVGSGRRHGFIHIL